MRNIERDFAIVFLAEKARKYMSIDTFITRYAEKLSEREEIRDVLAEYYLTAYTYKREPWECEGEYTLIWQEDAD